MVRFAFFLIFGVGTALGLSPCRAAELRVGAAAVDLNSTDDLVIGGGIGPGKAKGQEGRLRASALVVQDAKGGTVALVACDVLMVARDRLDSAARRIEKATGIDFDHILINATHTHHAPTTVTVHGYHREEGFTKELEDKIVEATVKAHARLGTAVMSYRRGEESSVGRNSRLLLGDGTIFWIGPKDDVVRPTGPFDPDLPVLAFTRPDGKLESVLFNHSTHTIGAETPGMRSPGFYGNAAQRIEAERGGTVLFFEGASGSTHNLDLNGKEMTIRIKAAVEDALSQAKPRPVDRVDGVRKEIGVKVRTFDEAKEDAAVVTYCEKRVGKANAGSIVDVFRAMRKVLAPTMGQERKTWIQAVVIGDIAFVGVPCEFFTKLGREIKLRSPYRETFVFELANDYIGYVPDAKAYDLGGYQTWTGLHSWVERGTGERIVDEAVGLLDRLYAGKE